MGARFGRRLVSGKFARSASQVRISRDLLAVQLSDEGA